MSKHTPGPWTVEWNMESSRIPDTRPMKFRHFITYEITAPDAPTGIGSDGETEAANARLIAAAPDLLAALRDVRREACEGLNAITDNACASLTCTDWWTTEQVMRYAQSLSVEIAGMIDKAIAKAEGGQP